MGGVRLGSRPRSPYTLLVGFFALASVQLLATVVRPPLPSTNVRWQGEMLALAVLLLIVSGFLVLVARGPGALPLLFVGALLLITLTTARAAGGQGQLVAGGYLTLLGLIAGLTLSRRWLVGVVIVGSLAYLVSTYVRSLLDSWSYAVGMTALFVAVSLVVQGLVGRLSAQATHDELTGALNRRGLEIEAAMVHERDVRSQSDTTVAEIDLDGFKVFNDTYGHAAGDELLTRLVADWTPALRRTDLLGRVGGDEFVVVLPATNAEDSERLLDRMREANATPWTAGLASWTGSESLWQALERADTVMYAQKSQHTRPEHLR